MKTVELQDFSIDSLRVTDREPGSPGPGEVLVRVRATSLNYRDLMIARGRYDPNMPLPRVPLSDGAGEVVETGEGCSRFREGDRVAGIFMPDWQDGAPAPAKVNAALGGTAEGMLREYAVLPETAAVRLPEGYSWEEGACLPCAAVTAWHALFHACGVGSGDRVLVQGGGGVSLFALQLARAAGAGVLAITGSPEKAERLRELGADAVADRNETPEWQRWVWERTGKEGVSAVIDVGAATTFARSLEAVRMGGNVAVIGVLGGVDLSVSAVTILRKQARILGIYVGSRAMFEEMNAFLEKHDIRPVIDRVFPLEEVCEAYRHLESGRHFGKVVVRLPE